SAGTPRNDRQSCLRARTNGYPCEGFCNSGMWFHPRLTSFLLSARLALLRRPVPLDDQDGLREISRAPGRRAPVRLQAMQLEVLGQAVQRDRDGQARTQVGQAHRPLHAGALLGSRSGWTALRAVHPTPSVAAVTPTSWAYPFRS